MQDSCFKKCVNTLFLFFIIISLLIAPVTALNSIDNAIYNTAVNNNISSDSGNFGQITPIDSNVLQSKEEKISLGAVLINEFVTDPKTDWDNSSTLGVADEWIELYNNDTGSDVNITGWILSMTDTTPENETLNGIIPAGDYFTILNPSGSILNDGILILYDNTTIKDSVSFGSYDDGNTSDNAPDGDADSTADECVSRYPNGQDTNVDIDDFVKKVCSFNASNPNQAPYITTDLSNQEAVEDHLYSIDIDAIDPEGNNYNFTLESGLGTIDNETGLFEWTPTAAGSYNNVSVKVTDEYGAFSYGNFTITVKPWLEILDVDVNIDGDVTNDITDGQIIQDIPPDVPVTVDVTLKNNGDGQYDVLGFINLDGSLSIQGHSPQNDNDGIIGIGAGGNKTFTLDSYTIPATSPAGLVNFSLAAEGYDVWLNQHTDAFDFQINVTKDPLEAILKNESFDNNNLTCDKTTNLVFNITNTGQWPILWYSIQVTGDSGFLYQWNNTNTFNISAVLNVSESKQITVPINLTGEDLGTYSFDINATDLFGFLPLDSIEDVELQNNNCPPNITDYYPTSDPTINENESQEFNVTTDDLENQTLTYTWYLNGTSVGSESNYTFESDYTGERSEGIYNVTAVVTDGIDNDSVAWTINVTNVDTIPVMDAIGDRIVAEDEPLNIDVNATDEDGDVLTYSKASPGSIDPNTGQYTWTPPYNFTNQSEGQKNVTITFIVNDTQNKIDSETITVTVTNTNRAPNITDYYPTDLTPEINEGENQIFNVSASDPDNDTLNYNWYINGNLTPNGNSHVFTSDFDDEGSYNIEVVVDDTDLNTSQSWTLTVNNLNRNPNITTTCPTTATEDTLYTCDVNATDPDGDNLTYSLGSPAGMDINSSTGLIEWTPTNDQVGNNEVTVTVSDGNNGQDNQAFNITVGNTNDAPVASFNYTPASPKNYQTITFDASASDDSDPTNDNLTYSWDFGDLNTNTTTEAITAHAYTTEGDYNVTLVVNDGTVDSNSTTQAITVESALVISNISVDINSHSYPDVQDEDITTDVTISIDVEVINNYDKTIEDIIVNATLESPTPSTLDTDGSSQFNLAPGNLNGVPLELYIPPLEPEGLYTVTLDVAGTGIDGNPFVGQKTFYINITRNRHDVIIENASLSLEETGCVTKTNLTVTLLNKGLVTEDDINLTISNQGLDYLESLTIELDKDNRNTTVYQIDTTGISAGNYPINVSIFYNNGNDNDSKTLDLTVSGCTIQDQTWNEGEDKSDAINLSYYFEDLNPTSFGVTGNDTIVVDIGSDGLVSFSQPTDWFGVEYVVFSATNGVDTAESNNVTLNVTNVNDAPYFITPLTTTFNVNEDQAFILDLSNNITDIDNDLSELSFSMNPGYGAPIANHRIRFYFPKADDSLDVTVNLTDGIDSTLQIFTFNISEENDAPNITAYEPEGNILITDTGSQDFSVTATDEDINDTLTYDWLVNGVSTGVSTSTYTYTATGNGTFVIKVVVSDSNLTANQTWNLTATAVPITDNYVLTYTDPVANATDVEISNDYAKVELPGPVDLGDIAYLDDCLDFREGIVAIETDDQPCKDAFDNQIANVTLYGVSYEGELELFFNNGFTTSPSQITDLCTNSTNPSCTVISAPPAGINGNTKFTVDHFTSFMLGGTGNDPPTADAGADQAKEVGDTVVLDGSGSNDPDGDPLTYSWTQTSGPSINLSSSTAQKPTFTPTEVGTYVFSLVVNDGEFTDSDSVTITVTAGTLKIKNVKVTIDGSKDKSVEDGETISKKAHPGSDVEFEINIENLLTDLDMEDLTVTVTIRDIDDGDDLDEEDDIDKIRAGKDEDVTISFNIPLIVDEETYDVEIEVEGDDEDGEPHSDIWNINLEVEKDKHDIIIKSANLNPETVSCRTTASLDVLIYNVGSEDEDEVRIDIRNDELGINLRDTGIVLDEGSDEDSKYDKTFTIPIDIDTTPGTYPIDVKAYYDGKQSDSETVNLEKTECSAFVQSPEEAEEEVEVHVDYIPTPTTTPITTIQPQAPAQISFRDTDEYVLLLIVLAVVLAGAVIFAIGATIIILSRK